MTLFHEIGVSHGHVIGFIDIDIAYFHDFLIFCTHLKTKWVVQNFSKLAHNTLLTFLCNLFLELGQYLIPFGRRQLYKMTLFHEIGVSYGRVIGFIDIDIAYFDDFWIFCTHLKTKWVASNFSKMAHNTLLTFLCNLFLELGQYLKPFERRQH